MKKGFMAPVAFACLMALGSSQAEADVLGFDITLNFGTGLTESQQTIFKQAESFWEDQIIGYAGRIFFPPSLTITASAVEKDGVGKILGSAGPTEAFNNYGGNGIVYTKAGSMNFDIADMQNLENKGTLFDVILHEMAHVIGFGTLWSYNGLYTEGSGQYTGAYALAAFQSEFDSSATYIPVELDGGEGTANGHWDEYWGIGSSDLMTGYLEGTTSLSLTTLAAFRDLGYLVKETAIDVVETLPDNVSDVPAPLLGGSMLLMLSIFAGRIRKDA